MNTIFIYIDQNILSLCTKGMSLNDIPNLAYVYSQEHLKEIYRSDSPGKYLDSLQDISAIYLDVFDVCSSKLEYQYNDTSSPHEIYEAYIDAINSIPFNQNIFNPLIAFLNGGDCYEDVQKMPNVLSEELGKLVNYMIELSPEDTVDILKIFKKATDKQLNSFAEQFKMILQEQLPTKINKEEMRHELGFTKGGLGSYHDANKIEIVSEKLKPFLPDTAETFFEYANNYAKQFNGNIFGRVIYACTNFDLFGFKSESKNKDIAKIPNILSDMMHIAYATFCHGLMSADKRLCLRAREIYNFEELQTKIFWTTNERCEEI